jgi:CIC family chloride channel protein
VRRPATRDDLPTDEPGAGAGSPASSAAAGAALDTAPRWRRLLRDPVATGSGFESGRYLTKWLLIGGAIGAVAGVGAIAFYLATEWATIFFLGTLADYMPPAPAGEGPTAIVPIGRPWLLPLVTALGGLISGLIVFSLAPEAEGHGTDAAIAALHHRQGRMRARIPPIKLIASSITIGSGGSGGREGPSAQISAGFGSLLGQWLHLSPQDRRIAVAAGMGAGIGAIFRAPLGGALMSAEILYLHDLEVEAIIPALGAAIVGYTIYGAYFGFTPIFGAQPGLALGSPIELLYYGVLGVLAGVGGLVYAHTFYSVTGLFHRLRLPLWFKPAIGGLLVGALGLVIPGVLHMGYGWVQLGMGPSLLDLPLWLVLVLPLAKIVATSLSIGSGGSGGIFGPGMVIGGMLGASFWRLGHGVLPGIPASPAPFVIVGMMALFGGIAHAPLAVMLMVAEMTGNLSLLAPAMVAVSVATALVGDTTIYRSQLPDRARSPAHRVRFGFPLLSSLLVRDAMHPPTSQGDDRAPVLTPDDTLDVALEQLAEDGVSEAQVLDRGQVVGHIDVRDVVATYRETLQRSVRRANALPVGTTLFEVHLQPTSPLAGRTLREAALPKDVLVASIVRDGETIFPSADWRLAAGDDVMILATATSEQPLRAYLSGTATT